MDENFKQLIEELRAEVMEKITDTTDRCRCMCLGALEASEETLDIQSCHPAIKSIVRTVKTLIRNQLK